MMAHRPKADQGVDGARTAFRCYHFLVPELYEKETRDYRWTSELINQLGSNKRDAVG